MTDCADFTYFDCGLFNIERESGSDMMFLYNRDNIFNDLYK